MVLAGIPLLTPLCCAAGATCATFKINPPPHEGTRPFCLVYPAASFNASTFEVSFFVEVTDATAASESDDADQQSQVSRRRVRLLSDPPAPPAARVPKPAKSKVQNAAVENALTGSYSQPQRGAAGIPFTSAAFWAYAAVAASFIIIGPALLYALYRARVHYDNKPQAKGVPVVQHKNPLQVEPPKMVHGVKLAGAPVQPIGSPNLEDSPFQTPTQSKQEHAALVDGSALPFPPVN